MRFMKDSSNYLETILSILRVERKWHSSKTEGFTRVSFDHGTHTDPQPFSTFADHPYLAELS